MLPKILLKLIVKKKLKENRSNDVYLSCGCIKGEIDIRDYLCTVQIKETPPKAQIELLPPIRNQLNIGSCASHAAISVVEIQNLKKGRYLELSELYHYFNVRKYINNTFPGDQGQTIRDACKCLDKYHAALEYAWQYDTSKFNEKPPFWAYMTSGAYKIKRYETIYDKEMIKQSILEGIPVICGIRCLENFFKLSSSNYLYKPKGTDHGGHAVTIVGYDNEKSTFLFRNSWSTIWGKKGYFEMTYGDFEKYSFDWWRVLI